MSKEEDKLPRRTSVVIPEDDWLRAKTRAAEEHTDLRTLLLDGLALRLEIPKETIALAKTHAIALRETYLKTIAREVRAALDKKPIPTGLLAMRGKKGGK